FSSTGVNSAAGLRPNRTLIPARNVADREPMPGLRSDTAKRFPRVPVTIGPGGLAPILLLAGIFAAFGARTGLPIVKMALLGGIGGTASLLVHELGHVSVARRLKGIRTASVSLIWMGAASRFEGKY